MNLKVFFKSFIIHTCIYATLAFSLAMLYCAICGMTAFAIATYFLILALCACLAAANVFMMQSEFKMHWRVISHAVLTLGGFYLCIILRYKSVDAGISDQTLTVLFIVLAVAYAICMVAFLLIRNALQKRRERIAFEQSRGTILSKERRNHKK